MKPQTQPQSISHQHYLHQVKQGVQPYSVGQFGTNHNARSPSLKSQVSLSKSITSSQRLRDQSPSNSNNGLTNISTLSLQQQPKSQQPFLSNQSNNQLNNSITTLSYANPPTNQPTQSQPFFYMQQQQQQQQQQPPKQSITLKIPPSTINESMLGNNRPRSPNESTSMTPSHSQTNSQSQFANYMKSPPSFNALSSSQQGSQQKRSSGGISNSSIAAATIDLNSSVRIKNTVSAIFLEEKSGGNPTKSISTTPFNYSITSNQPYSSSCQNESLRQNQANSSTSTSSSTSRVIPPKSSVSPSTRAFKKPSTSPNMFSPRQQQQFGGQLRVNDLRNSTKTLCTQKLSTHTSNLENSLNVSSVQRQDQSPWKDSMNVSSRIINNQNSSVQPPSLGGAITTGINSKVSSEIIDRFMKPICGLKLSNSRTTSPVKNGNTFEQQQQPLRAEQSYLPQATISMSVNLGKQSEPRLSNKEIEWKNIGSRSRNSSPATATISLQAPPGQQAKTNKQITVPSPNCTTSQHLFTRKLQETKSNQASTKTRQSTSREMKQVVVPPNQYYSKSDRLSPNSKLTFKHSTSPSSTRFDSNQSNHSKLQTFTKRNMMPTNSVSPKPRDNSIKSATPQQQQQTKQQQQQSKVEINQELNRVQIKQQNPINQSAKPNTTPSNLIQNYGIYQQQAQMPINAGNQQETLNLNVFTSKFQNRIEVPSMQTQSPQQFQQIQSLNQRQMCIEFLNYAKSNNLNGCMEVYQNKKQQSDSKKSVIDLDFKDEQAANTALHYAAIYGNLSLVNWLLFNSATIDPLNALSQTPFILACKQGYEEICCTLLTAGADINSSDRSENTGLHYAALNGHNRVVELLLKNCTINFKKLNQLGQDARSLASNLSTREQIEKHMINQMQVSSSSTSSSGGMFVSASQQQQQQQQEKLRIIDTDQSEILKMFSKLAKNSANTSEAGTTTNISNRNSSDNNTSSSDIQLHRLSTQLSGCTNRQFPISDCKQPSITSDKCHSTTTSDNEFQYDSKQCFETRHELRTSNMIEKEKIGPSHFAVLGLIGKGSFGEVYLVEMKSTYSLFAMKVLHKSKIIRNNLTKYAISERNVMSVMRNPFIVRLYYAFQTSEKLFLIMDYCPGGDLGELLQKEKKLSEDVVRVYLAETVLALEDLHKRDIIFRDLKPDNIVLDRFGHIKLTDFGLSKEGVLEHSTGARSFCGSFAYLAPEMLKRCGHGKAVDWYLLGVLMFELLVGIPPYYASNKEELFENIEKATLKIPSHFSAEARSILKALLQRNPAKRLGSGKGDSEEIKAHPFFNSINWESCLAKQLNPPKPNRQIKLIKQIDPNLFDEQYPESRTSEKVIGWSFAQP